MRQHERRKTERKHREKAESAKQCVMRMDDRMGNSMCRELGTVFILAALSFFFCWFFIGRFGIFGSKTDWISQHSVIPEYFRRQFYETGDFFPEFAPNIGGGQNIYNFSYYGLYSPVILFSYLMPSVKMGDYIMASSMGMAALSAILFYLWLRSRTFSRPVSFWSALMLELSGPLIFHSSRHVMFVNYMPFLIMALWGIDRYFGNTENTENTVRGNDGSRNAKSGSGNGGRENNRNRNEGSGKERSRNERSRKIGLCLQRTFFGSPRLYIAGVFLMILTSFYFSVGGILVLCIYGLHRYAQVRRKRRMNEKNEESYEGAGVCRNFRYLCEAARFGRDAAAFLLPIVTAVCMSAFLLIPTAYALAGKRDTAAGLSISSLFTPDFYDFRLFYNSYGIGLTSFAAAALIAGLFLKKAENRILIVSCIAVLLFPVFPWILNGGLYPRDKALIPFLPLMCYVTALYAQRMQVLCDKNGGFDTEQMRGKDKQTNTRSVLGKSGKHRFGVSAMPVCAKRWGDGAGAAPYVFVIILLIWETGYSVSDWTEILTGLPLTLLKGGTISFQQQRALLLLDAFLMLLFYLIYRWRKNIRYLIVPPLMFLAVFGASVHGAANVVSRTFYDRVTDEQIGQAIESALSAEDGFYRMEQCGSTYEENMANVNRIWLMEQYSSSIYSSSYHDGYRNFCRETFGIEEPTRNALIQQASQNPSFRRLMGVKYVVTQVAEHVSQNRQQEQLRASGYELCYNKDGVQIYRNEDVAPVGYVTEHVITQEAYEKLSFPYNQIVPEYFAVTESSLGRKTENASQEEAKRAEEALFGCVREISLLFPKAEDEKWSIIPIENDKSETDFKNAYSKVLSNGEKTGKNEEKRSYEDENPAKNEAYSQKADSKVGYYEANSYHVKAERKQKITILADEAEEFTQPWVLYLQFTVKNAHPSSDVSISVEGIKNKLSASSHLYKNENTVFTYAVPMQAGQTEAEMTFDSGEYDLMDIRCFAKQEDHQKKGNRAYGDGKKTGWMLDDKQSKGSRLTGTVRAEKTEWFVTSIPYDENFEVFIDGINTAPRIVNTAFLGFMIPKGEHTVTFVYHAPGLALGKAVSALGTIFCVLLFLFYNWKNKRIETCQ